MVPARGPHAAQHEQAAIAAEQQRRIDAIVTLGAPRLIADTTALMTAVYSQHYFGDDSLLPEALAAHRREIALTLLCCPEGVPWQRDGCLRDGEAARQAVHERLLALLRREGLRFELLKGPLPLRLERSLTLIAGIGGHNPAPCSDA